MPEHCHLIRPNLTCCSDTHCILATTEEAVCPCCILYLEATCMFWYPWYCGRYFQTLGPCLYLCWFWICPLNFKNPHISTDKGAETDEETERTCQGRDSSEKLLGTRGLFKWGISVMQFMNGVWGGVEIHTGLETLATWTFFSLKKSSRNVIILYFLSLKTRENDYLRIWTLLKNIGTYLLKFYTGI